MTSLLLKQDSWKDYTHLLLSEPKEVPITLMTKYMAGFIDQSKTLFCKLEENL